MATPNIRASVRAAEQEEESERLRVVLSVSSSSSLGDHVAPRSPTPQPRASGVTIAEPDEEP